MPATPTTSVAIAFQSAAGHTARQAAAVVDGAASVVGATAALARVDALSDDDWAALDTTDAVERESAIAQP